MLLLFYYFLRCFSSISKQIFFEALSNHTAMSSTNTACNHPMMVSEVKKKIEGPRPNFTVDDARRCAMQSGNKISLAFREDLDEDEQKYCQQRLEDDRLEQWLAQAEVTGRLDCDLHRVHGLSALAVEAHHFHQARRSRRLERKLHSSFAKKSNSCVMPTERLLSLVVRDVRTIAFHYDGEEGIRLATTALLNLPLWDVDPIQKN
jgi:hypothetical protein